MQPSTKARRPFPARTAIMILLALSLLCAGILTPRRTALAADTVVDLELVLAVDASGSVSQRRFDLQRDGYAAAFRDAQVLRAILSGLSQSIAVTMFQWTGPRLQAHVVPWMVVKDDASAKALADAIAGSQRRIFGGGTSISGAMDFAMTLFPTSGVTAARRVIDISGDGANNNGRSIEAARQDVLKAGVTINGLPILSVEPDLDDYFERYVIGGDGAFMVPAKNYESFGDAIVKKLIAEIARRAPQARRFAGAAR
jgi:hypothetical protein